MVWRRGDTSAIFNVSKAQEYQDLHGELRTSRGVRLNYDLLSRQITFYTFQHNHAGTRKKGR